MVNYLCGVPFVRVGYQCERKTVLFSEMYLVRQYDPGEILSGKKTLPDLQLGRRLWVALCGENSYCRDSKRVTMSKHRNF